MKPAHWMLLLPAAALTLACTRVPEIEDRLSPDLRASKYPTLMPLGQTVQLLANPSSQSDELEADLDARASRLRARAKALREAEL